MRKALFIVGLLAVACCNTATGSIFQRDSTVKFKVIDFDGNSISNAAVRVNTFKKWMPGEGFGRDVFMDVDGKTDANGETKIFANYSPKKNGDPDPKWGKLFV